MKKIIKIIDCLILNNIKFIFIKLFNYNKFYFEFLNLISLKASIDIQNNGKIVLDKMCNILSNTVLGVRENGILKLEDGVFINTNCKIIAHKNIEIRRNTCIGPNTIILDHDHKFGINGVQKKNFISESIIIGENVWIGANVVILKGVRIGNNAVIAAGSIVTKDVPSNSILIQKKQNIIKNI